MGYDIYVQYCGKSSYVSYVSYNFNMNEALTKYFRIRFLHNITVAEATDVLRTACYNILNDHPDIYINKNAIFAGERTDDMFDPTITNYYSVLCGLRDSFDSMKGDAVIFVE